MTHQIEQPSEPKPGIGERTILRLTSVTSYPDRFRAYKVQVDGELVGKIEPKNTMEFSLVPGLHEVMLSIDWCKSNIVEINIKNGETLAMECGSSLSGRRMLLAIVYIMFLRNRYLWLRTIGTK